MLQKSTVSSTFNNDVMTLGKKMQVKQPFLHDHVGMGQVYERLLSREIATQNSKILRDLRFCNISVQHFVTQLVRDFFTNLTQL